MPSQVKLNLKHFEKFSGSAETCRNDVISDVKTVVK